MASAAQALVDPWQTNDPITDALRDLRIDGLFCCRSELTAPWAVELPAFPGCMMFHVVTVGQARVEVDRADPCVLEPGRFALVPHGGGHLVRSGAAGPVTRLVDAARDLLSPRYEVLRIHGGGERTEMLCGLVRLEHPLAAALLGWLPRLIVAEAAASPRAEWLRHTLDLLRLEASHGSSGSGAIVARLADVLVVDAIRTWLAQMPTPPRGWLGAWRDPHIGPALALIHRRPERPWTVAALARAVGMSRSGFAARFTERVGRPVLRYLTEWRMQLALHRLRTEDVALADLATRLGYESEAAFSRAFKRWSGMAPGAMRARSGRSGRFPGRLVMA